MKKYLKIFFLTLTFTLISCSKNTIKLEEFNEAVDNFHFEEDNGEVTTDFSLPLKIKYNDYQINIEWEIIKGDNFATINESKIEIERPKNTEEDVLVELNANFHIDKFTKTKKYEFKILKHEKEDVVLTDKYVVYINMDGFAKYYYDLAVEKNIVKNLESLKNDGIFFNKLRNEFPSITNPMQAMILSGATSSKTQNVYRYYDKSNDIVVQQNRENSADNLYTSAVRNKVSVATVRHFPAEGILSPTDLNALYINTPNGVVATQKERFSQAIKLVKGEEFLNGTMVQQVKEVPRLLTIYLDELDAFGHNDADHYDKKIATTEAKRLENVLDAIAEFDIEVGKLVDAYKERGIYDKTVFFITTDHGMTPFGHDNNNIIEASSSKYSKTKWPELRDKLKNINNEYIFEYIAAGKKPKDSTSVVGVSSGLQMLLTFKNHRLTNEELDVIAREIEKEYYVYDVITRKEISEKGIWRGANIDLIVVPKERYHFHGINSVNNLYRVRGQHDSSMDSSNNIFGLVFGGSVKGNSTIDNNVSVLSFGTTMAEVLGINLRDSNKESIKIFEE